LGKKLTGCKIFGRKLMGYIIFKSDETRYRGGKSLIQFLRLLITRISELKGCGIQDIWGEINGI